MLPDAREVEEDPTGKRRLGVVFDYHFLFFGKLAYYVIAYALLGNVRHPLGKPPLRVPGGHFALLEPDSSSPDLAQPGDDFGQLALAIPRDPGHPQDLPRPHLQADSAPGGGDAGAHPPDV